MPKLNVLYNKTLKLTNVLVTEVPFEHFQDIGISISQMENYIRSKGFQPIGPHIQYMNSRAGDTNVENMIIKILRQSSGFIHHVDKPYAIFPVLKIPNCLYVRYVGPQECTKLAFDKINLVAYEEDIPLKGSSYTIFLGEDGDNVTTDIFVERDIK